MEAQLQKQKTEGAEVKKPNLTGIPTQMKLDFERRSGLSFDDVRVHYNSDKPARLGALAYTQGTQIHVGPGQERSLPHELGHVIQQKAGRVRPTRWIGGRPVNDQPELEREADLAPVQCMPAPALWGVVQMYTEDEVEDLMGRFRSRGWKDISKEDCRQLLSQVDRGGKPRIGNHYAILQRISTGVLWIVERRFSGTGPMGRTAPQDGAQCTVTIQTEEFPDGAHQEDDTLASFQRTAKLHGPPRKTPRKAISLAADGPASMVTQVLNAEYLHYIAHQLGGTEEVDNLMPGLHALNTAMIPLESLAANLAKSNIDATYTVKMLPRPGPEIWASSVIIVISIEHDGIWHKESLSLAITENEKDFLNKECYDQIKSCADRIQERINQFLNPGQEQ